MDTSVKAEPGDKLEPMVITLCMLAMRRDVPIGEMASWRCRTCGAGLDGSERCMWCHDVVVQRRGNKIEDIQYLEPAEQNKRDVRLYGELCGRMERDEMNTGED